MECDAVFDFRGAALCTTISRNENVAVAARFIQSHELPSQFGGETYINSGYCVLPIRCSE